MSSRANNMTDKLTEIFAQRKQDIAQAMTKTTPEAMAAMARARRSNGRPFHSLHSTLRTAVADKTLPLIAEVKKASPSRGVIRADFSPINITQDYLTAGATALSILTEPRWFQGDDNYLRNAASMTQKPILQKDFIFCDYQLHQASAMGADVVLLILSALDDKTAKLLEETALDLGLEVLLETHDEVEIARANAMQSPLIGVNNRDLKNLVVSLTTGEKMLEKIHPDKLAIAESGLTSPADVKKMWDAGARGFLIGEYFMKQPDVFTACHDLVTQSNQLIFK
ncbi:MAG: indole-3-glycerol phosphate synthase TrpC [Hydrotalea sp.]|nr:indole-3-glycerol phosphate synthase TrpC [Hydrotalea sp.]